MALGYQLSPIGRARRALRRGRVMRRWRRTAALFGSLTSLWGAQNIAWAQESYRASSEDKTGEVEPAAGTRTDELEDDTFAGDEIVEVAQETGANSDDAAWVVSSSGDGLSHRIKLTSAIFLRTPQPADLVLFEIEYRPRWTATMWRHIHIVAEPLVRATESKATYRFTTDGFSALPERQTACIKEAFVRVDSELGDVAVGWQFYSWGKADGVNPLNVFAVSDYTDRLREEPLGVPSISVTTGNDQWIAEAVWVPVRLYSVVPYDRRNLWGLSPDQSRIPIGVRDTTPEAFQPELGEAGLRFGYNGDLGDVAVMAARSIDHTPTSLAIQSELDQDGNPVVFMYPTFARFTLLGATGALPIGPYLFRLDAGYFLYDSQDGRPFRDDSVRVVAGAERQWDLDNGRANLRAIVQYALDHTAPAHFILINDHYPSPFRPFQQAIMGSLSLGVGETIQIETKGLVNVVNGSWTSRSTLTYRPRDGRSLWVGADFIGGPSDSVIGQLARAYRVLVGLEFLAQ